MKLRKFIAIFLMSFANIFILVHAVTPHSHHDGIVCFKVDVDQCTSCEIHHSDVATCCEGEGDYHSHLEDCNLPQVVERGGNPIEDIQLFLANIHCTVLDCILIYGYYDFVPIDLLIHEYGYNSAITNTYNSPYVGSIFGLRAPPTSIIS